LMTLWANTHGGFAIGFIWLALTVFGQAVAWAWRWWNNQTERAPGDVDGRGVVWLGGVSLLCALAVMLNPAGPSMLLYPFKTVSIGVLQDFIQEWQSPNFHQREAQIFLWLIFATLAAIGVSRRRINFTDLTLVCGIGYLGFLAGRNVALFSIVAPPVLSRHLVAAWEDWRGPLGARRSPAGNVALNWLILILVSVAALLKIALPLQPTLNQTELARIVPMGAAEYVMRAHPPGKLFNSYNFGAYLAWALYPDYPVYVDGRTDLYNDEFLREYLDVATGGAQYEATLARYDVQLVIVEPNALLSRRLDQNPRWRLTYADATAVVYQQIRSE